MAEFPRVSRSPSGVLNPRSGGEGHLDLKAVVGEQEKPGGQGHLIVTKPAGNRADNTSLGSEVR